jgi:glutamate/tyrosine decarboxylase-like PLP-dependent enzyme
MSESPSLQQRMFATAADRDLFEQAKNQATEYMEGVFDRPVFPTAAALAGLAAFDEPLPAGPCEPAAMLRQLHQNGSKATVASTGGRYFGLVVGSVFPPVVAARWLADAWDQCAALHASSPVASKLEAVCERWLIELLGLPAGCAAGFVGGSSTATAVGLAAARHELLRRQGWDVNAKGLFGAPPIRVVIGAEAHGTVFKALALLGLGRERVELVPVDGQGRMVAAAMPALDERTLVFAQAGNVNTGAFDPFEEICDRAAAGGAWVHVDGAFGLWAAAVPRLRHLVRGVERADAWSVDAHKTLNAPYDNGIILCRHPEAVVTAMQNTGAYIIYGQDRDGMLYTPEMSRRAHGVELWATLKSLGRDGAAELVSGLCDRAVQAAGLLREAGFRILNEVVFNQVLVACDSKEQTLATMARLQASGECWCGGSTWQGTTAIRLSVSSWATTAQDIERTVAAFVAARNEPI